MPAARLSRRPLGTFLMVLTVFLLAYIIYSPGHGDVAPIKSWLGGKQGESNEATHQHTSPDAHEVPADSTKTTFHKPTIVDDPKATTIPNTSPDDVTIADARLLPNILDPDAVDAQVVCPGYKATDVQSTAAGITALLTLDGKPCYAYGTDVEQLTLTVEYQSEKRLFVSIKPAHIGAANQSWFEIPEGFVGKPKSDVSFDDEEGSDLHFTWTNEPTFSFTVLRRSTEEILFSTVGSKLVYEDQFIEFVTSLPEGYNLYGLGERFHALRLGNDFTATMYAADNGNPIDPNLYGSHPFYLETRYYETDEASGKRRLLSGESSPEIQYDSSCHGVFLRNAHPLEARLSANNLTWRALGGSLDLYFLEGPTQAEVTSQYQAVVGFPAMHQYWTLGYHQSRWGYSSWDALDEQVTLFKEAQIPLETLWTDLDYMNHFRDFENNQERFSYEAGEKFLEKLHSGGRHYIPIVDSAIYYPNPNNASDTYETYRRGHELDVFMKEPAGNEYVGAVWPGHTVFPDWLSPNATQWWTEQMSAHYSKVKWSGIWIDMSEVASFCTGPCGSDETYNGYGHPPFLLPGEPGHLVLDYPEKFNVTNATEAAAAAAMAASEAAAAWKTMKPVATPTGYLRTKVTPGIRQVEFPPYVINNIAGELGAHTAAQNATHAGGVEEYDIHSLFGHSILRATYTALRSVMPDKRPFIIGRSTFAGSGRYAGHWGGDNNSNYWSMYFSISQALSMSLFGIPMFGPDVCGFSGNADHELCARWMELGAFFPFYRNHNVLAAHSQEPYVWSSVATASRAAMNIRYRLLPYTYTLMHLASTRGETVMRALAWEFPCMPSLAAVDNQFLLGPAVLVTPVLEPLARTVRGVFPGVAWGQVWYDWYNGSAVLARPGENVTMDAPLEHINVHVRGGFILPMQGPGLTTKDCRDTPWEVLVALDSNGAARGHVYIDDGESQVQDATLWVDFSAAKGRLWITARGEWEEAQPLGQVVVLGVAKKPFKVLYGTEEVEFVYEGETRRLLVSGLEAKTAGGAFAEDWVLTWA